MSELPRKKRDTRNVYIRHTQSLINEIKELINNFDPIIVNRKRDGYVSSIDLLLKGF